MPSHYTYVCGDCGHEELRYRNAQACRRCGSHNIRRRTTSGGVLAEHAVAIEGAIEMAADDCFGVETQWEGTVRALVACAAEVERLCKENERLRETVAQREADCEALRAERDALRADAALGALVRTEDPALVERLADLEHERWSGWMRYQEEKVELVGSARHPCGELYVNRWRRLMITPYAKLTEREKESDRIEVRKTLAALRAAGVGDTP